LDNIEIREDFRYGFAAVGDFGQNILCEALVDEAPGLAEFEDLMMVHRTGAVKGDLEKDQSMSDMVV
jgi:hypothetical protein